MMRGQHGSVVCNADVAQQGDPRAGDQTCVYPSQLGARLLHRQAQPGLPVFFAQSQQFEQGDRVFLVLILLHPFYHHGHFAVLRDDVRCPIGRHVIINLCRMAFEV